MSNRDMNSMMKDMMGAFPVDTKSMEDVFKNQAALGEKLSSVCLSAAEKSTEIQTNWTKSTLEKLAEMSRAKTEPADYAKALSDFASANAEVAAENMAAFAEVAKRVQSETVELMMSAGRDIQEDASQSFKKASDDMSKVAAKSGIKQ